jgi:hypothetical protein
MKILLNLNWVVSFQLLSFDPPVPSFFISIIILRDYFHFSPTPKKTTRLETQRPLHWPMLCVKTKASPPFTFRVSIFALFCLVLLTNTKKDNEIGATGATALANALRENKSITTLNLHGKYFLLFSPLCFSPTPKKTTILETQGPVHWPMLCVKTKASLLFTFMVSIFFLFSLVLPPTPKKTTILEKMQKLK